MGRHTECLVVGAGPAGLAAAAAFGDGCLIVEAGRELRDRVSTDARNATTGVGGAGLYSDGKFSYWPSATELWTLEPDLLGKALDWGEAVLARQGIPFERPVEGNGRSAPTRAPGLADKRYPSHYATLEQRDALITALRRPLNVKTGTALTFIEPRENGSWTCGLKANETITADRIIWAGGRFGPLSLAPYLNELQVIPRRLEFGIRIVQPSHKFFLRDHPSVDPKLILSSAETDREWRTFCCCRDGEYILSETLGLATVSGRADGPRTSESNVGFLARLTDPEQVRTLTPHLLKYMRKVGEPFRVPLISLVDDNAAWPEGLPTVIVEALREGLNRLMSAHADVDWQSAFGVGPCWEGVGSYPRHNDRLEVIGEKLWVAGDCAGSFRGIVAALLSGYIAGLASRKEAWNEE